MFAGYASNGEGANGVARAQAVAEALSPAAVFSGNAELVADPPPNTLVAGTEGSVYLISWKDTGPARLR